MSIKIFNVQYQDCVMYTLLNDKPNIFPYTRHYEHINILISVNATFCYVAMLWVIFVL